MHEPSGPMSMRQLRPLMMGLTFGLTLLGCGALPAAFPQLRGDDALEAQKTATQDSYYKGMDALSGQPLLVALHRLIRTHKDLGYDGARDVMFGSLDDADGDNVVFGVYDGYNAKGVTDHRTAYERGLNAEHTWPQSLGAQSGAPESDLHHLFPASQTSNSQRNNHPYGEVEKVLDVLPDYAGDGKRSCIGTRGQLTVFEPRDPHKGDVARAIFYFYTCYAVEASGQDAPSLANFKLEQETLLRWHQRDPVSPAEKARNEAIYKLQGNRNPFVDHPEWVAKIGRFLR